MCSVLTITERMRRLLPIYSITVGFNHVQHDMYRPKGTFFHHFLCVNEGEGFFNFNGVKTVLKKGSAVFLRKEFPVDYGPTHGEFRTSWVTFDGDGATALFEYFDVGNYAVITSSGVLDKIAKIYALSERNAPPEMLSQKVYELAIEYFSVLKKQNGPFALKKAKEYIEKNYNRDISVENIASFSGISQSLLFKLFREKEKSTPTEYLRAVRIAKASQLLIEGKCKIYETASACGFSDVAYFCKVFKAETGITPNAYKNKLLY
ncbi:MAG: helix-turn-helix transcriptional regulator [Clostridia bacterium]|nr:helix-turn-helix transcriptional regulator [Clostridia bacterium]